MNLKSRKSVFAIAIASYVPVKSCKIASTHE